jgi:uncharacterized protein YggT (Ycf19 family)
MTTSRIVLYLTNVIISIIEFLIGLRIVLKLLGASTSSEFVSWLYDTTQPLLAPFEGMFPSPAIDGLFLIEFSALFALLVYAFIGYLITELVAELTYMSERRVSRRK